MRQKLIDLEANLYQERTIRPVRRGDLAGEYDDKIADFTKVRSLTGSFLQPYLNTETHGANNFDNVVKLLVETNSKVVLDVGCGAGELAHKLKRQNPESDPYGITIHLGEVRYAREVYGLEHTYPIDMREMTEYFENETFDAIVIFGALQYISEYERVQVIHQCYHLLKDSGLLIVVGYYGQASADMPDVPGLGRMFKLEPEMAVETNQGDAKVYRKVKPNG